jgi:cytochrome c553
MRQLFRNFGTNKTTEIMEEKYAYQAKNVAFLLGFIAFLVFLFLLKTLLIDEIKPKVDQRFYCGVGGLHSSTVTQEGKTLFINNCASCHAKTMRHALTGPPLIYWQQYLENETALLRFLHNPSKYPKKRKNPEFRALQKLFSPSQCTAFPSLTETDVAALAAYIDGR